MGASWRGPGGRGAYFAANFPRSVFLNRESFPLAASSRIMAEYRVAAGVLPPGLVQYPLAAICSNISFVVIAVPASASTRAAASRAETFFGFSALAAFALAAFPLAGAALRASGALALLGSSGALVVVALLRGHGRSSGTGVAAVVRRRGPPAATPGGRFGFRTRRRVRPAPRSGSRPPSPRPRRRRGRPSRGPN